MSSLELFERKENREATDEIARLMMLRFALGRGGRSDGKGVK